MHVHTLAAAGQRPSPRAIRALFAAWLGGLAIAACLAADGKAQALVMGMDGAIHLDEFSEVDANQPVIIQQEPVLLDPSVPTLAAPLGQSAWPGAMTVCPHCQGMIGPGVGADPHVPPCLHAAPLAYQPLMPGDVMMLPAGAAMTQAAAQSTIPRTPSLARLLGLENTPWLIGGWTQAGYHSNNQPLSFSYNDLLSFNDVPDHLHLNQQWLYIGRATNGARGWDVGGRIDLMYGTDGQKAQAFGNPNGGVRGFGTWDNSLDHGEYGWAIPQAYGEVALYDLTVKIGHFLSPMGYESVASTQNFFYSRSYTQFWSEPFTHTGVLATYAPAKEIAFYGGWALGWDTGFDQLNSGNIIISGVVLRLIPEVALSYMNTVGNFGWRDGGADDSYAHSIVLTADLTERLQYVAQSDLLRTDNPGVSTFDTIGLNNYLFYKISDRVRVGGRYEWWKADGISFNQVTAGANVFALQNLVFRPEARFDWSPAIDLEETTYAVDAILSY